MIVGSNGNGRPIAIGRELDQKPIKYISRKSRKIRNVNDADCAAGTECIGVHYMNMDYIAVNIITTVEHPQNMIGSKS